VVGTRVGTVIESDGASDGDGRSDVSVGVVVFEGAADGGSCLRPFHNRRKHIAHWKPNFPTLQNYPYAIHLRAGQIDVYHVLRWKALEQ